MPAPTRVVLLAGGFGGARMAHGFDLLGELVELTIIGNTADDLELHGLAVSPDLDTVMYTLAGLANAQTGWGVSDETWSASAMLERYGQPTWFGLGDRDLATHITRTARLRTGESLTEVTAALARALGVRATLLPMTDDRVRTKLQTADGWLDFQDYFVRRGHADDVSAVLFEGIEEARPTADVVAALDAAQLVVIAPSNPFVSVAPILALPGLTERLAASEAPVVAVSPIVGGAALRGPAASLMRTLGGLPPTCAGVAAHYARAHPGLVDVLVIDERDQAETAAVAASGIRPLTARTVIATEEERRRLAGQLLTLADAGARAGRG
ncbi:2-phospho-L-lactate transferase [soil metagenome]